MEQTNVINATTALIVRDFGLETTLPIVNELQLIEEVAHVVAYMIEHKLDLLLSTMYTMDVSEHKINRALSNDDDFDPINFRLAKLIVERQKMRVLTKLTYKSTDPNNANTDNWKDIDD